MKSHTMWQWFKVSMGVCVYMMLGNWFFLHLASNVQTNLRRSMVLFTDMQ